MIPFQLLKTSAVLERTELESKDDGIISDDKLSIAKGVSKWVRKIRTTSVLRNNLEDWSE